MAGKVVCMDCGTVIQDNVPGFEGVSHGLCASCAARRQAEIEALRIQRDSVQPHGKMPH